MELEIRNLTKQYGKKMAVNHLNLSLTKGVYGLLGANGAGKTTLMRLLCGIQAPTSGRVTLNGRKIEVLGEDYRKHLGYLPQQFPYYPNFSALDYLLYIAALKGLDDKKAKQKSKELLGAVGLTKNSRQKIRTFSGGMKQRLGIAQALLNHPKFLLFDEPTAGLDPKERIRFRNIFSKLSEDCIVLFATHIVSDIELIANEIILMNHGHIIKQSKREELIKELDGKVWEICADNESKHMSLQISQVTYSDNRIKYRTISDSKPTQSAKQVEATLEDVYLYYFGEDTND